MKQGRASSNVNEGKREPNAHAVNPGGASQLGEMEGHVRAIEPLYAGRGYEAPKAGTTTYPCGTQGRHK